MSHLLLRARGAIVTTADCDCLKRPQFQLGQQVTAIGFVDCFGKPVAPRPGLIVTALDLVRYTDNSHAYWRVTAEAPQGSAMVEGAERFFTA